MQGVGSNRDGTHLSPKNRKAPSFSSVIVDDNLDISLKMFETAWS